MTSTPSSNDPLVLTSGGRIRKRAVWKRSTQCPLRGGGEIASADTTKQGPLSLLCFKNRRRRDAVKRHCSFGVGTSGHSRILNATYLWGGGKKSSKTNRIHVLRNSGGCSNVILRTRAWFKSRENEYGSRARNSRWKKTPSVDGGARLRRSRCSNIRTAKPCEKNQYSHTTMVPYTNRKPWSSHTRRRSPKLSSSKPKVRRAYKRATRQ